MIFNWFKKKPKKEYLLLASGTRRYSDTRSIYMTYNILINKADIFDLKVEYTYRDYLHKNSVDPWVQSFANGGKPFTHIQVKDGHLIHGPGVGMLRALGVNHNEEQDRWYINKNSPYRQEMVDRGYISPSEENIKTEVGASLEDIMTKIKKGKI